MQFQESVQSRILPYSNEKLLQKVLYSSEIEEIEDGVSILLKGGE